MSLWPPKVQKFDFSKQGPELKIGDVSLVVQLIHSISVRKLKIAVAANVLRILYRLVSVIGQSP